MFQKIQKGAIHPFPPWIPDELKDLIKKMLTVNMVRSFGSMDVYGATTLVLQYRLFVVAGRGWR